MAVKLNEQEGTDRRKKDDKKLETQPDTKEESREKMSTGSG